MSRRVFFEALINHGTGWFTQLAVSFYHCTRHHLSRHPTSCIGYLVVAYSPPCSSSFFHHFVVVSRPSLGPLSLPSFLIVSSKPPAAPSLHLDISVCQSCHADGRRRRRNENCAKKRETHSVSQSFVCSQVCASSGFCYGCGSGLPDASIAGVYVRFALCYALVYKLCRCARLM